MEELKKLHSEKLKETKDHAESSTIGSFLLKNHQETFENMKVVANDMAKISIKRFLMLSAESDGIDLLIKFGGQKIYEDKDFCEFIIKINEYFEMMRVDKEYETTEQYEYQELLIYEKFKGLLENVNKHKNETSEKLNM